MALEELDEEADSNNVFGKILFGEKGNPDIGRPDEPTRFVIGMIDFPTCDNCGLGSGMAGRASALIHGYNPKFPDNCPMCGTGHPCVENHGLGYKLPEGYQERWEKEIRSTLSEQYRRLLGLE